MEEQFCSSDPGHKWFEPLIPPLTIILMACQLGRGVWLQGHVQTTVTGQRFCDGPAVL